ncbi:hypothetical protein [Streptomyces azureus]|uniref:Uncharacterized protein n=1 Tax=Streptomyces azureus TaxID=146537 RepID=A0A0K8PG77_STRAJ|nr:hypothetical protein [Streptomyces azureus]GAP46882.1 predicted protein [Streptomyces azureus]
MPRYHVRYLNGDDETIEAAAISYDADKIQYLATAEDGAAIAYIPIGNILSIVAIDKAATTYPYQDGDVTVLGPEVFASPDGETISWKGENYTRRFYPLGR